MGRTSGRLVPFLKKYLFESENTNEGFINLKFEDDQKRVFYVIFPRYLKDNCEEYEKILKAWYHCNGKLHKYKNYSKGKSVFQAALKKSIYLMKEKKIGKHLRYRFATEEEIAENRRKLKEREQLREGPDSPVSSTSSGYHSEDENMNLDDLDFFEDLFNNPEKYLPGYSFDENIFSDIEVGIPPKDELPNDFEQISSQLPGLTPSPVFPDVSVKKYWLCTQTIKVKSTLQLICELKVIDNEESGIKEGSVIIPNGVFEPGISYDMKRSFELDDLLHIFLVPNVN